MLMNNAVFGKTMKNVDNKRDIKLLTNWENNRGTVGAGSLIPRPSFRSCSIFNEYFLAMYREKLKIKSCKPIYVRFSLLELSKTMIYDFFYGFIKESLVIKLFCCIRILTHLFSRYRQMSFMNSWKRISIDSIHQIIR